MKVTRNNIDMQALSKWAFGMMLINPNRESIGHSGVDGHIRKMQPESFFQRYPLSDCNSLYTSLGSQRDVRGSCFLERKSICKFG